MPFVDRVDGGRRLAAALGGLRGQPVVVLGLPRGGVPVAAEVARALDAPLDVILVRKLGVPVQPELAMGAIGEDGVRVLNDEVLAATKVSAQEIAVVEARERDELDRRARLYRGERERIPLDGRIAVVVDDGIATGSTARAACQVARAHGAKRVVLATPVAPQGWVARIGADADECVAVDTPPHFWAIGQFYDDFSPTSDDEVIDCLTRGTARATASDVEIPVRGVRLLGTFTRPPAAQATVVFAHGSGSSRHSTRNQFVATVLQEAGLATLLFDLLTAGEEADRANVFDVELLGHRLTAVTAWVREEAPGTRIGYFGASTGAAAALWAAAEPHADIAAVVSRGGRPDLAGARLPAVTAPTLLIVGGEDDVVLELNREALAQLRCEARLEVIPGATHLFSEPGTLEAASRLARDWFVVHLTS